MMVQKDNPVYEVVKKINRYCASLSGLILLFITLSIFVDVIQRYLFNSPSVWITEVSSYLFLYIIFLGTSYALQMDLHIRVTFLSERFGPRISQSLDLIGMILSIIFCGVLLWQTSVMTWTAFVEKWTTPTMLGVPYALIYVSMVIGSAMLLITLFIRSALIIINIIKN